ncbi:MAG: 23S rRNA (adenine(2503)-C(2))-methyltransferase RlmN [Pseudomonadota bacterium]|nr:23S rRNA (adenine(2503)-C(2))-methyltransferase RlmN [Pseudomonadota bacterium]
MDKVNVRDLSPEGIEAYITHLGKEKYRARQLMKWLYHFDASSFQEMTTLSRQLRHHLEETASLDGPEIAKILTAADGTKKVLLRLRDGLHIESVLIPGRNHWTACLSTQVGCAMGCRFCFTGALGFRRQLTPGEITGQFTALRFRTPEGPKVKNVVLMGMGEPLANYDHTVTAVRILTDDAGLGLSNRRVTISTCGLAPWIVRLGQDVCVNLAISLNAPDDERRDYLMPINKRYPLATLLAACRDYPMPGRRMLTFEYILMAGVNDSPADAEKVARLLKNLRCKLNLIVFNEFPGAEFRAPAPEAVAAFQQTLLRHHYTSIIRASRGSDILAACGQLTGRAD